MTSSVRLVRRMRGQVTIYGLIITFITLIAFIALNPVLEDVISDSGIESDTAEGTIIRLFSLVFLLAILASFLLYVSPRREAY